MRHASKTFFVLLLAAASVPMGCKFPSVVDEVRAGAGATEAGGARLILSIGGDGAANSGARTIVPNTLGLVVTYSVLLQKGATSQTATSATSPVIVSGLEAGSWNITVSGLDASSNLLAQGSTTVTISVNQPVTTSVTLTFIQSGGTGAVNLTLTFPHSVGVDAVDATLAGSAMTPAPSILPVDGVTDKVVLSQANVAAGSPLLRVFFKKAGTVLAGVVESVWVFQNVTTTSSINLQSSDFGAPPSAPTGLSVSGAHDGSLILTWTDTSNVADAYVVRRSSAPGGPFVQVGADLAFDATGFSDTGLAAGTTCYYQVTGKNRFGESSPVSASATTFAAVAAPTFAPAPGPVYSENQSISLSSTTPGAAIYYTVDGTTPSSSSTQYTGPVSLSGHGSTLALKAIAVAAGMTDSGVAAAAYAIDRKPMITNFAASQMSVYRGQSVTITTTASDPEGGAVSYTYAFTAGAGTVTGTGASVTALVGAAGANTITVTVTDSFGSLSTASLILTGVNQAPVISSLTATPSPLYLNWETSVYPNTVITDTKILSFSASDPDGDTPLTYAYSITSGSGSVSGSGSTATFTTGISAGMSTVHAVVTDSQGASASMDVQIKVIGWNQLADSSTSRYGHTAVYDGAGNMIIFGGYSGGMLANDLWRLNISSNTWTNITPSGNAPGARAYHSAIYHDGKMVVFGGLGSAVAAYKDVWEYDFTTHAWTELPSNPVYGLPADVGVYSHSAVYDGNGNMIVFGGMVYGSSSANNQVWKYSFSTGGWTQLSPSGGPPLARYAHSAVYAGNGRMIVFGGRSNPSVATYYNDVWNYDISMNAWKQLASASAPGVRYYPCAIYDGGDNMVIFGGFGTAGWFSDVWQYRISSQSWTKIPPVTPPTITPSSVVGRISASAVYDGNGNMIIFGGINNGIAIYYAHLFVLP